MANNSLSPRAQQLRSLANQMPKANEAVSKGLQQARATQIQTAVGSVPAGTPALPTNTASAAQNLGTAAAAAAGQAANQQAVQQQKQAGAVAEAGLATQAAETKMKGQNQAIGLEQKRQQQESQLQNISQNAKNEILDKNLSFQQDELGRTYLNETQLADWAVLKAKDANELASYKQASQAAADRKLQILKTAHERVMQEMRHMGQLDVQHVNQASKRALEEADIYYKQATKDQETKMKNTNSMWEAAAKMGGDAVSSAMTKKTPDTKTPDAKPAAAPALTSAPAPSHSADTKMSIGHGADPSTAPKE